MKAKLILILTLTVTLLLPGLLFAGTLGKGRAEIFNGNETAARDQALQNALTDAVKKGVGTIIDAETEVKNWEVIRDEVYSSAKGYVSKYSTTRDERVGKVWFYEIDAEVSSTEIEGKLQSLRILHKKMGNKRLMVIYRPTDSRSLKREEGPVLSAQSAIETLFNSQGFRVFEDRLVSTYYEGADQSSEAWLNIAKTQSADILVEFELISSGRSGSSSMFKAARAEVLMRVFDVSTGRLIANQIANQKQLTNANAGSFDWNSALGKAGAKAGKAVGELVVKDIVSYYEAVGDMGNSYFMRFTGFDQEQEDIILSILEAMAGYQSLSELANNEEMIEVEYFSNLDKSRLRRKLKLEAKQARIPLRLMESKGNRFEYESIR